MGDLVNFLNFQFRIEKPKTASSFSFKINEKKTKMPEKSVFSVRDISAGGTTTVNPMNSNMPVARFLDDGTFDDFITEAFYYCEEKGMSLHCVYFNYLPSSKNANTNSSAQPKIALNNLTSDAQGFNPRLGMLLLPPFFQFVKFKIDANDNIDSTSIQNCTSKRSEYLYSPIVLQSKYDTATHNVMDFFHPCSGGSTRLNDGNTSIPVVNSNIAGNCGTCAISNNNQKFNLFFYDCETKFKGKAYKEDPQNAGLFLPSSPNVKITNNFYLIPIVLADGMIVYYAIDTKKETSFIKEDGTPITNNHIDKINTFYKKVSRFDFIVIKQPLVYNDYKSIFVCDEVEFG